MAQACGRARGLSAGRPRRLARAAGPLLMLALALAHQAHQAHAIKIDCYPVAGATKEKCESLGCVWSPVVGDAPSGPGGRLAAFERPEPTAAGSLLERHARSHAEAPRVDEPWCHMPEGYAGYKVVGQSDTSVHLERARASFMGPEDVKRLTVSVRPDRSGKLLRLTIEDADKRRFVPELPRLNLDSFVEGGSSDNNNNINNNNNNNNEGQAEFKFALETDFPSNGQLLNVYRVSTGDLIFSTDLGRLIFADKFLQLNSRLSSPFVYGLGEHYSPFLKWANGYKVYSFWNSDRLPQPGGTRSYGGFPFFVNLDSRNQSRAHGLYLRNSNAMDVVLQSDLSITFRPIGGVLDFFLLAGPTPLDVARQFVQLVGLPELPARWGLGFHLCRYNYNSLERTKLISKRTRAAGIPFDVQWNDVDALERSNDFYVNQAHYKGLAEFVDELHAQNMHYIPLVDPGISQEAHYWPYELGTQMGPIWIRNASGQTLVGRVWNQSGRTVFPDFSLNASHDFWKLMFVDYQKRLKFDGAWIDMNDISNFADGSLDGCPSDSALERPPYMPGGYGLQVHSICLSAQHALGSEYDMHNLYSSYEAIATKAALAAARPGRRTVIISRSSHPGQGAHSGHWNGDLQATWDYLRWTIPSLLEHSMYGFTLAGADICGFAGNTTPELCARWSTLGAFYTFARNHNDDTSIDQDPVALGPTVVAANKNALTKRYSLLPYLYTLVYRAHKLGEPVARSVAFEFFSQNDKQALRVEDQFMWGRAIMLSPVVTQNTFAKATYLPEGRWYETDILPESQSFDLNRAVPRLVDAKFGMVDWHRTENVSLANMPIFYRGGHIIPVYAHVKATIADTERNQPLALEIALCQKGRARGELYLDDGESIEDVVDLVRLRVQDGTLNVTLVQDDYKKEVQFGLVKVLGVQGKINQVTLHNNNGGGSDKKLTFQQKEHALVFDLQGSSAPLTKSQPIVVSWTP